VCLAFGAGAPDVCLAFGAGAPDVCLAFGAGAPDVCLASGRVNRPAALHRSALLDGKRVTTARVSIPKKA